MSVSSVFLFVCDCIHIHLSAVVRNSSQTLWCCNVLEHHMTDVPEARGSYFGLGQFGNGKQNFILWQKQKQQQVEGVFWWPSSLDIEVIGHEKQNKTCFSMCLLKMNKVVVSNYHLIVINYLQTYSVHTFFNLLIYLISNFTFSSCELPFL